MANYKLGPVIGKIGGVEVQKIPVDIVADGNNTRDIMHTVHVPEGETWLVVLSGDLTPGYTTTSGPELRVGEVSIGPQLPGGHTSITAEVTGTAEISIKRNTGARDDRFVGHVYTTPLP